MHHYAGFFFYFFSPKENNASSSDGKLEKQKGHLEGTGLEAEKC